MRNGKGSLRRPMAVKPEAFANSFARTFGTTAGTLKERRTAVRSTETDTQGSGPEEAPDRQVHH
ncbi:MAG TPA: hypothetical protein VIQ60_05860 [Gemmatimonadaceae bacterium]